MMRRLAGGMITAAAGACAAYNSSSSTAWALAPPRPPLTELRVVVTSTNPEKTRAVAASFNRHDATLKVASSVVVEGVPADSGIPHGQPWGMQHTYEGAQARLHHVKVALKVDLGAGNPPPQYVASVENGIQVVASCYSKGGASY